MGKFHEVHIFANSVMVAKGKVSFATVAHGCEAVKLMKKVDKICYFAILFLILQRRFPESEIYFRLPYRRTDPKFV